MLGQNDMAYVQQLTDEFTQKLKERDIQDYMVTQHVCSGKIEMFKIDGKMCVTKDTYVESYVLWKEDGQTFLKKIDNCGLFHSIPLQDDTLYETYMANRGEMMKEKVGKYKSETYGKIPAVRRKVQPCGRVFMMEGTTGSARKAFSLFDISNESEGGKNLNYESNMKLKIVEFNEMISEEITKHTFKRFKLN
ncbi:MAG: hypothetical protein Aureis2KO_16170 [Aureisphaera sp.]